MSKKGNSLRTMLMIGITLVVLAVVMSLVNGMIRQYRETALQRAVQAAEERNQKLEEQYAIDLAALEQKQAENENAAWPAHKQEGWDVIDLTSYPVENARTVSLSRADIMNNGMLLVNQWHSRPADFDESAIVSVGRTVHRKVQVSDFNQKIFPVAIDALIDAVAAAKEAGHEYYMVSEGYRSYDDQDKLFQKQVDKLKDKYTGDELIQRASRYVNYPGTSEFNSGLAFTMRLYKKGDEAVNKPPYITTDAGIWMNENCWKYGLVFRFPLTDFPLKGTLDKSYKTGVSSKLLLYRYVGKGNAAVMHLKDFVMEEYIEYLAEHPHLAVFEDGTLKYEILREQVGDDANVNVTVSGNATSYVSSLDNMGYAITVYSY